MKLTEQMQENEMWHQHAGNGWAVLQLFPDEWARVVQITKDGIGDQAFLVWTRKLTPGGPIAQIAPGCIPALTQMRESLESGEVKVVNTRFVNKR